MREMEEIDVWWLCGAYECCRNVYVVFLEQRENYYAYLRLDVTLVNCSSSNRYNCHNIVTSIQIIFFGVFPI